MTLLGKIFTVLIFIMCLMVMFFSVSVYMTHKNWKDEINRTADQTKPGQKLGLKHQLENLKNENTAMQQRYREQQTTLHHERASRAAALAALEEQYQTERQLREQADKANGILVVSQGNAVATVDKTQLRLDALISENKQLRADIRSREQDRDLQLEKVVFLTDQLHQARDAEKRLKERQAELVGQIARQKSVLDRHGLDEFERIANIPPPVDGVVLAVKKTNLEVSIGSDDGIRGGHEIEVFRGRSYLGRARIVHTSPDRAVAVILPEYRKGDIQKGDRVHTRTKISRSTSGTLR